MLIIQVELYEMLVANMFNIPTWGGRSRRQHVYDIMKGITIILMMIGHTTWLPEWLDVFIYSFHMPLFFILAGLFTKSFNEIDDKKKYIYHIGQRLIIPYFAVVAICAIGALIQSVKYHNYAILTHSLVRYFFALDCNFPNTIFDLEMTPIWFLLALFWAKIIFLLITINIKIGLVICTILSFCIISFHQYIVTPWCIGRGLEGLIFVACGWSIRHYKVPVYIFLICISCWIVSMLIGKIDLFYYQFNCLPIDVLGAIGGTFVLYYLSLFISKLPNQKFLVWAGANSLSIICLHTIESSIPILHTIVVLSSISLPTIMYFGMKHGLTICGVAIFAKIPFIQKIFH